jgi:glycerol-3-phosphate acyltransferase PlsX
MRLALDAMGGDHAPSVTIEGALEAVHRIEDLSVTLVGNEEAIQNELARKTYPRPRIKVKHASQVVEMDEPPIAAMRRKKDSSIRIALDLVKSGEADAFVSMGNSGVVLASALFVLGKMKGVDRPAIATVMPTLEGRFVLIDAGANVDCRPSHLLQFAIMGEAYAKYILDIQDPRIGLLSIGEEDIKGNELTRETFGYLKLAHKNFIGNIEGKDIFHGEADVVVCDGFVGNIALKISEGLAEATTAMLRKEIASRASGKIGYFFLKNAFRRFKKKIDYSEYGGAPLLGTKSICIIGHGRSTARAISNAIKLADEFHRKKVLELLSEEFNMKMFSGEKVEDQE